MNENLLDDFFKDKLQNFSSPIPPGAWEKVIEETVVDPFIKNKLEQYESSVPENTFDKIAAKQTLDSYIKDNLEQYESAVPGNTFDGITAKRTLDHYIKDALIDHESAVPAGLWDKMVAERETDLLFRERLTDYASSVPQNLWYRIINNSFTTTAGNWFNKNAAALIAACLIGLLVTTYAVVQNKKAQLQNSTIVNEKGYGGILKENNHSENSDNKNQLQNSIKENTRKDATGSNYITPYNQNYNTIPPAKGTPLNLKETIIKRENDYLLQNTNTEKQNTIYDHAFNSGIEINREGISDMGEQEVTTTLLPAELYTLNYSKYLQQFNAASLFNGSHPDLVPCPNSRQIDWFVEPYLSADYSMKMISNTGGLSATYLQLKDSAESMRVGFSAGIRISKRIGDHIVMKGGVQYSQLNEQLALKTENERKTTTVIVTRTISRPQGDTTISDTTSVTQIGYRITKNINHYRNIEIPLTAGYEFGDPKDKWKFAVNGGVALNIASWYSGYTLDTSLTVTPVQSKGSNAYYKKTVGVSILGSVSVIRNIDERTDAFIEPYFKYGISSINSAAGFSQKFNTIGVQAGIRFKLNYVKHHY